MEVFKIKGKNILNGTIRIPGAKNSVVALIPASLLGEQPLIIDDTPDIEDVKVISNLIEELGAKVILNQEGEIHKVNIDPSKVENRELLKGNVEKMRASYYLMGALLGRFNYAKLGIPGGCFLGPRPIDLHLKGFEALGAKITDHGTHVELDARENGLVGTQIYLDFPSVGATINIMLAATKAKGKTTIENAAREPEIIDVAILLNNMGANIKGVGTEVITIEGVDYLGGCYHQIIPDRIQAGTYAIMGALSGDKVIIDNIIPEHMDALVSKLHDIGVDIEMTDEQLIISGLKNELPNDKLKPVRLTTGIYPGFPTDIQQPFSVLMTQTKGESHLRDTIYPARSKSYLELNKMGANIEVLDDEDGGAIFNGGTKLHGATVSSPDLRGGVSLVIAGLIAEGETTIDEIYHIERGYENIVEKLQGLGANIVKEEI